MTTKKKIIFFDGDGTLWYPKKTKRRVVPEWVYRKYKKYKPHLILTPTTRNTLQYLHEKGILLVILSTHPHEPKIANAILKEKVKHFKIEKFIYQAIATKGVTTEKGTVILRILRKLNITKKGALMVGDSYLWDYQSARRVGIDAVMYASHYQRSHKTARRITKIIQETRGVLIYV